MNGKYLRKMTVAVLFFAVLEVFVSCQANGAKYKLPKENLVIQKSDLTYVTVSAELAKTKEERNYGFMNRKNIPDGTGMLFIFEKDQVLNFWMKNTPHPLSIAYISADGVIVDLFDMTPFSEADITSTKSVRYALEVPQGWFEANGVKPGDIVKAENGSALRKL